MNALGGAPGTKPLVVDPFAGGGSIPLEAVRVGADVYASDLNPVADIPQQRRQLSTSRKTDRSSRMKFVKWGARINAEAEEEFARVLSERRGWR